MLKTQIKMNDSDLSDQKINIESQYSEQVQLKLPFMEEEEFESNDNYLLSDLIFLALPSPSHQLH